MITLVEGLSCLFLFDLDRELILLIHFRDYLSTVKSPVKRKSPFRHEKNYITCSFQSL